MCACSERSEIFWDEFQEGELIDDEGVPNMNDQEVTPNSWQRVWSYNAWEGGKKPIARSLPPSQSIL